MSDQPPRPSRQTGSLYRAGGSWGYVIDLPRTPVGRRRQQRRTGFPSKAAAGKAMRAALRTLDDDEDPTPPERLALSCYLLEQWLPGRHGLSPSTITSYTAMIRNHIVADPIGPRALTDLRPMDFDDLYRRVRTKPARRRGTTLSPKTVPNFHRMLKKALNDAVQRRLLTQNPLTGVAAPKARPNRGAITVWTPPEIGRFLTHVAASPSARWLPLYGIALATGARRGELLALRWARVDLDAGRLQIVANRTTVAYKVVEGTTKTAASERTITLQPQAISYLEDMRRIQHHDRATFGSHWIDSGYVFTTPQGNPVHPDYIRQRFIRDIAAAGVRRVRFHDLRHTYATYALTARENPKAVSERLGHASVEITLAIYAHVLNHADQDSANRVADALFAATLAATNGDNAGDTTQTERHARLRQTPSD